MSVSQFKATCLAVLERVRRTGEPLVITKHGIPIAQIVPPPPPPPPTESAFGCMASMAEEVEDILTRGPGPAARPSGARVGAGQQLGGAGGWTVGGHGKGSL